MEALSQSKDAAEKQSRGQEAIDWSQFTPVKPEGAFEKYLRDQEKLESAQTAASSGGPFLGIVVNVGLALAVGYGLFRLISPRSVSTAVHVGQRWLAWTAMAWSAVQLKTRSLRGCAVSTIYDRKDWYRKASMTNKDNGFSMTCNATQPSGERRRAP
jgi:hypothetical protein